MCITKDDWTKILAYVIEKYDVTEVANRVWLEPLVVSDQQIDGTITVLVLNDPPYALEYVKLKYSQALQDAARQIKGEEVELLFGIRFFINSGFETDEGL